MAATWCGKGRLWLAVRQRAAAAFSGDEARRAPNTIRQLAVAKSFQRPHRCRVQSHAFALKRTAVRGFRRPAGAFAGTPVHYRALVRPFDFVEAVTPVIGLSWVSVEPMKRALTVIVAEDFYGRLPRADKRAKLLVTCGL